MLIRFMYCVLVVSVMLAAPNEGLMLWCLMFVICFYIVVASELQRRYTAKFREHEKYLFQVQKELVTGVYRQRFKNIITRHGWVEEGKEGVAAISLANAIWME